MPVSLKPVMSFGDEIGKLEAYWRRRDDFVIDTAGNYEALKTNREKQKSPPSVGLRL